MVQHPDHQLHHKRGAARARFRSRAKYNWQVLLSGYAPQYAYELGALDSRIPFEELRKRSYINPKARAIGNDRSFQASSVRGYRDRGDETAK